MKTRILIISALIALVTSGCGQKDSSSSSSSSSPASTATAANSGPRTVEITAGDNMKYSLNSIDAKPGEKITVVLTNIGTQPKEVMAHNWILLKAGSDAEAFDKTAAADKASGYFPDTLKDEVLAHIELLGPRKSGEVTFNAPTAPGSYTFLCTFPAHFQVGMKGTLNVK